MGHQTIARSAHPNSDDQLAHGQPGLPQEETNFTPITFIFHDIIYTEHAMCKTIKEEERIDQSV